MQGARLFSSALTHPRQPTLRAAAKKRWERFVWAGIRATQVARGAESESYFLPRFAFAAFGAFVGFVFPGFASPGFRADLLCALRYT